MPIYKQTTEITNIDDLLSSVERDIEEVYFGDKNVFTVWGEYDGTLPAQYSANGDYLADYRIYGSAGGVGDDSGTAYGYEVDMGVSDGTTSTTTPIYIGSSSLGEDEYIDYDSGKIYRRTNNKFNPAAYSASGYLHEDGTTEDRATTWRISDYIPVIGGQAYTMVNVITSAPAYCWYNANKEYIAGAKYNAGNRYSDITATAPENAAFIRASYAWDGILSENAEIFMIVDGSTVPAEYKPYVEPEDPPVPLPALPTVDGTNITDYAGQSAAPSRLYAKHRKEGF